MYMSKRMDICIEEYWRRFWKRLFILAETKRRFGKNWGYTGSRETKGQNTLLEK